MSAHDRAAARATPKFDLTISRYSEGCSSHITHAGLREHQAEALKAVACMCWPYPQLIDPSGSYHIVFELVRV